MGCRVIVFVVGVLVLRMILISIDPVGCVGIVFVVGVWFAMVLIVLWF